MNEEQIRNFIRIANAFLKLYLDESNDYWLNSVMEEIYDLAKKLRLPYIKDDDDDCIIEWTMPSKREMKDILKRADKMLGDAM